MSGMSYAGKIVFAMIVFTSVVSSQAQEALDFNRDVRPIFSDKCFACHGPDAAQRKADLRLDQWDEKKEVLTGETSADTELFKRITSSDPDYRMPPPDSNLALSEDEVRNIVKWIDDGADAKPFWAFIPPPRKIAIPRVRDNADWGRNPVDAFVLDRLGEEGLSPSETATPEALLRRVSLDLTGLPPTIEAMDAFMKDSSDVAYGRVVEELLASTAYGERMAADWLDVARYADTFGYQSDRDNYVWPWRDWLIGAYNDNLPYDDFITWQVAGDLLPNPTQDQRLATAFNRLHRQTNEGGSVLEEYRVEYVVDRVNTFGTAFLGMSLECARCHDHKFDPVSQQEYYELSSFFDNIDESGMYSHYTSAIPTPALRLYKDEEEQENHEESKQRVSELEAQQARAMKSARKTFKSWDPPTTIELPDASFALNFDEVELKALREKKEGIRIGGAMKAVATPRGSGVTFSGDSSLDIREVGVFDRSDSFSFALWLKSERLVEHAVVFHRSKAAEDAANRGYELVLDDGKLTFSLCHFWPGNSIRVEATEPLLQGDWHHAVVTYDGSSRADGVRIYVNGERQETRVIRDGLTRTIQYSAGSNDPALALGARGRDIGFANGVIDEFQVYASSLTAAEIRLLFTDAMPESLTEEEWFDYYVERVDEESKSVRKPLHEGRLAEAKVAESIREIMTMRELPARRTTYVLERGEYGRRKDEVDRGTPESLPRFSRDLPKNRLGLSQWLTDPNHPLTARVAVNRIWKIFFGRGLVESLEDFGNQGTPPTHPLLLDYLARHFVNSGWDVKELCTLIVTSATYQQSSAYDSELYAHDPDNILLARGPRSRMSAEQIRDAALFASELLSPKIGGPSVRPYQPPGLWKQASSNEYKADTGEGLYRRGMYTFWKRTVPPPTMLTFDAPSREVCVARRQDTTTPLQALVLLNDPQYVEAARVLAEVVMKSTRPEATDPLVDIVRRLIGRFPSKQELAILEMLYNEQLSAFNNDTASAEALISVGERESDESLQRDQLAALTSVAQAVMNFDEFVMKR